MICAGTGCVSNKSLKIRDALEREVKKAGLEEEILIVATGCNGFCAQGPIVVVQPEGIFYQMLSEDDIPHLVEEHLLKGRPVERLMYTPPEQKSPIPKMDEIGFFAKQKLIALKNRGLIDPEKIDEYIARDGYKALAKALSDMTAEEIIQEIKDSGLRGRGGAGFPTGRKWESCRKSPGDVRYIICNADEGDPGAFMDRSIIESDPHSVIEGMIIGAKAIGSSSGYVYIRAEYPIALERLNLALEQARDYGLLGQDILCTGFNFDITVFTGAGAFICGESSSLRASIEGKVPEPVSKVIHATEKGLWEMPTVLNNVETWANVPQIIDRGAIWFSSIGTEKSKGTKVFSLVGKIRNAGLVEVPMGITLNEIIYDIGDGIPDGKNAKAAQTGGPSGGCIPESLFNTPVDFDRLTELGSMMGSGGLIVMDEDTCMVDVARYFLDFLRDESCGKCTTCREGIAAMHDIVADICRGEGKLEDITLLEDLAETVAEASLCALGGSAPNPVLSTLRYFRDEYEAHIKDKRCPAGVCRALIRYRVDPEKCKGCLLCNKQCPEEAIQGKPKEAQTINEDKCIKCGICFEVCKFKAVMVA
jgi:NADH:ubiquinone oxidoreductase subunit F (NADH-binding)/(2Fe-2S) ferredoxin/NAD-dependent dihydropyrimidine dehydrogenase PreA subunit